MPESTDQDGQGRREPRRAGFFQVARAVFWSFLGIRRKSDYGRDAVSIRPHQVIIAGVIGAALFVLTLVLIVRYITSS